MLDPRGAEPVLAGEVPCVPIGAVDRTDDAGALVGGEDTFGDPSGASEATTLGRQLDEAGVEQVAVVVDVHAHPRVGHEYS